MTAASMASSLELTACPGPRCAAGPTNSAPLTADTLLQLPAAPLLPAAPSALMAAVAAGAWPCLQGMQLPASRIPSAGRSGSGSGKRDRSSSAAARTSGGTCTPSRQAVSVAGSGRADRYVISGRAS
jgi:hypothetical protein